MANFFDQFDQKPAQSGNYFDQFDGAPAAPQQLPNLDQRVEDIIGGGGSTSPMNDPELADSDAMRDTSNAPSWGQLAKDTAVGLGNRINFGVRGMGEAPGNLVGLMRNLGDLSATGIRKGAQALGVPDEVAIIMGATTPAQYLPSKASIDAVGDRFNAAAADMLGMEPPRGPITYGERGAQRLGEEIGGAMIPAAGILTRYGGKGLEAAQGASGLARFFGAESAAVAPTRYAAKEATAAAAAGTGAHIANPNGESAWRDAGGALAGVGAYGIGSALMRSTADIGRSLFSNGGYADEVVIDAVMRDIANGAGIPAAPGKSPDLTPLVNATNGPRVSDTIPGFQESLADRTKNPGLAAMEYSRQSGPNAGFYAMQRANNTRAIDNAVAPFEPAGTPGQFSGALEAERSTRLNTAATATADAQTAFDDASRYLAPVLTAEGRGSGIRAALQDASEGVKAKLEELWRPINDSQTSADAGPILKQFGDVDEGLSVAETRRFRPPEADIPRELVGDGMPAQATGILDADGKPIIRPAEPPSGDIPLNEITGIRSSLTDQQREAATAGRSNEARILGQYINAVDGYVETSVPSALRGQYDAARAATRDYHDRFSRPQSAIGQTLAEREGMPRYPDNSVAGRFVQGDQGRISEFNALMREAGSDERVRSGVRDQVLQDVRDRGLMDNPRALDEYLGQYKTVFDNFPELKSELGSAGALRSKLAEAARDEQQLRSMLTQQSKSNVAKYLTYGDENAKQAMKGVLASRNPSSTINELMDFVGDAPEAVQGARKAFWDVMQERSRSGGRTTANIDGSQPWSPRAWADFLDNPANAAVAQRLYQDNPEHLTRIREISEALKGVDTRNAAKAPNSSGTAQGMHSNLLTPEALQSRWYAYRSGRISGTFLTTSIASAIIRRGVRKSQEQGYQRMMDDILTNADSAALLMKANNPANRQAVAVKAKTWFGPEATNILNAMSAGDQNEDHEAIMRMEP